MSALPYSQASSQPLSSSKSLASHGALLPLSLSNTYPLYIAQKFPNSEQNSLNFEKSTLQENTEPKFWDLVSLTK
jgi:hypothetical protein